MATIQRVGQQYWLNKFSWTKTITFAASYTFGGEALPGAPKLPDRNRMTFDGRWP